MPQHVHVLHSEHPFLQPSAAPPLEMLEHASEWIIIRALTVSTVLAAFASLRYPALGVTA